MALETEADELFYGGAAGGGKTDLLLGAALTQHHRSTIFRREYPQLEDIATRMNEILGTTDYYNQQSHTLRMPDGRSIRLASIPHDKDREKHKGRPKDLIGWDELPDFSRDVYRFVNAWNRTSRPGQRCRVIATGNPPTTPEGEWVIEEWGPWLDDKYPNPAKSGEIRWYVIIDNKTTWVDGPKPIQHKQQTLRPRSRTFVFASVEDNPIYMASGYDAILESLPDSLREMLRYGKFNTVAEDHPFQVIPTAWVRAAMERGKHTEKPEDLKLSALSVDVARGGDDKTVISKRYGNWFAPLIKHPGKITSDGEIAANLTIKEIEDDVRPRVDVIGVGSSCFDFLKAKGARPIAINFAEKSLTTDKTGKYRMRNRRAEHYWRFREALAPTSGQDVCLPDDRELLADLCAPRFEATMAGILIEEKEEIKKRIGRSPDCADAVVMAAMQGFAYG